MLRYPDIPFRCFRSVRGQTCNAATSRRPQKSIWGTFRLRLFRLGLSVAIERVQSIYDLCASKRCPTCVRCSDSFKPWHNCSTSLNEVTQTAGQSTTQLFPGTALNYLPKLSSSFGTLSGIGSPKCCKHVRIPWKLQQ